MLKNLFNSSKKGQGGSGCNDLDDAALLTMAEEKIKQAPYAPEPPSVEFKQILEQRVIARRQQKDRINMDKFFSWLQVWFVPKRLAPAVAALVIVSVLLNVSRFSPGALDDTFSQFSRLLISPAYAMDNFTLEPEALDSLGVAGGTAYILKSKEAVDTKLIKESLRVEPAVAIAIEQKSPTEWKIKPQTPLPANTLFKVALKTSFYDQAQVLQSRDYSWAYQVKDTFKIITHIPGNQSTGVPTNSGIEVTFSHDSFTDFEKFIAVEPATPGKFEKHGRAAVFVAKAGLAAGTVYTVTIKAGLPLSGSSDKLAADYVFRFETETRDSFGQNDQYFNVYDKFFEFSTKENPVVQVYANNPEGKNVDVKIFNLGGKERYLKALDKRDQVPWWAYSRDSYLYDTAGLPMAATFSTEIKKGKYVQFLDFPAALPAGYYIVNLSSGNTREQAWFQVTDISAYFNITKTDTIVWAHNNVTARAAAGAQVRLVGQSAVYNTDDNGIARFKTPAVLSASGDEAAPRYLEISAGGQSLIMPAAYSSRAYSYYDQTSDADDYWRYLYTDRPKYQPTDTIKFWGLVKNRDKSALNSDVKLILSKDGYVDYYYQPINVAEQTASISSAGTFSGEFKLENLRPDYYTLTLRVGDRNLTTKYIEIRPYVKPAYQLTLTPETKTAWAGDTVNLTVQASFFEGTPVPGLPLVFKMPEGEYKATTDESGQAHLTYLKKYFDCTGAWRCWPDNNYLSIAPQDPEMAEISGDAFINFYGPKVFAQTETNYPKAGVGELKITARQVDLPKIKAGQSEADALLAPNTRVAGTITKISYTKVEEGTYYDFISKKIYPSYRYDRSENVVKDFAGLTGADGRYILRVPIEPETAYRIDTKIFDSAGRYDVNHDYLYYYDGETTSQYDSIYGSYYSFKIPPGKTYSLGETVQADMAKNDISLPDNDGGQYLFLKMQSGLKDYALSGNSVYSFNFNAPDVPNVNLIGVRYKDGVYFSTDNSYFTTNRVSYNTHDKELNISVSTDKNSYAPGEEASVSVSVKDKNGNSVPAAVNINIVDEAYYAVAGDTADPLSAIYTPVSDGSFYSQYSHKTLSDVTAAEKGGCFLAGTKVLLADGTTRPIEDIKAGDKVATYSDPLRLIKATGDVSKTFDHVVQTYLVINDTLRVTPEHLLYSNYSFKEAGLVKAGDWLLGADGRKVAVQNITVKHETVKVYNFTVEPQHTYFADGFYVHNDKGGGVRDYFTDAPLFQSAITNSQGQATVKFTLPDNITTWRATVQAISNNIDVGAQTAQIKVTKPVFADITVGQEYLAADEPVVRLRAFGTALQGKDEASFTVSAPTLNFSTPAAVKALAFKSAYVALPKLTVGKHDITYSLATAKGNDALRLPLKVVASELSIRQAESAVLTTDTKITSSNNSPVYVLLADKQRLELLDPLENLSWSWGDRIDQAVSRKKSRQLLNEVLKEDNQVPEISANLYQQPDGGIALLPYGQSDLELSARLALAAAEEFDADSLSQYFLGALSNDTSNREQTTFAITGLAALKAPVLPLFNNWRTREDLTVKEKLYLALAAHRLGADELARSFYYKIAADYAHVKEPNIIIKISDNADETQVLTALTAVLASGIQAPERAGLWSSVRDFSRSRAVLLDLDKLMYAMESWPRLRPIDSQVAYEINGIKHTLKFAESTVQSFEVLPADLASVRFTEVKGDLGITTITERPVAAQDIKRDADIAINREYFVNGKATTEFKENDLVEIRLSPVIGKNALRGDYQIIDILPNGLLPVTKLYGGYYDQGCHVWYPYDIDGQKVKYHIWSGWNGARCNNYIAYFARVKTRGKYQAEPAILQSLANPDFVNYSPAQTVVIK